MAAIVSNKEETLEKIKEGFNMVYFTASWCGPCKMLRPVMEEIGETENVLIIDVDDNKDFSIESNVTSIPTVFFVKDNQVKERMVGYRNKEAIEQLIATHKGA